MLIIGLGFLLYSCEKEERTNEQLAREEIMAVENLLRDNQWNFIDMTVKVKLETMATPLLANVADENGIVQPGLYDSYAIYGNNFRQLKNTYTFERDDILLDTANQGIYNKIAGYYVLSTSQIRINPDSARKINFDYYHNTKDNSISLSANSVYSSEFIAAVNTRIVNSIISGTPDDLANTVVDLLMDNEKVSDGIERFLYDLIHTKIDEITQSPDELSEKLARFVVDKLKEVDWEDLLYDKILEFLQNLQAEDPEVRAAELAQRMAEKIEASLSYSNIYDVLLPILEEIENETLPVLTSRLAAVVYEKIAEALSEENIYNRVYPVWEEFTTADSITVIETADTLAAIASARFFNADTLTEKLTPFVQSIKDTPTLKLSALAQEIIDDVLIPSIDQANEKFPGLELEPDWKTIKPLISGLLTTLKAKLGSSTVEELSADLAISIIDIMDLVLQKGFEKAIYSLQQIPADQVASVVASWITNLVEMVEQPVIDFIEGKLNEIFENFEAVKVAQDLASLIHAKIVEEFSEENLYNLFLPLAEAFREVDMDRVARVVSSWIIDAGLIPDDLTEEDLISALIPLLSDLIGNIEPDNATQKLVDLLLNNNLVKELDGKILKQVLTFKIYELQGRLAGNVNAVEEIAIIIKLK